MIYADVYVYVRSGPYRGMHAIYERRTTYEVLEDGLPPESGAGDSQPTPSDVGTGEDLVQGDRPGCADQGVPDGQTKEEGEVTNVRDTRCCDDGVPRCVDGSGDGGVDSRSVQRHSGELSEVPLSRNEETSGANRTDEERPDETTPRQLPLL